MMLIAGLISLLAVSAMPYQLSDDHALTPVSHAPHRMPVSPAIRKQPSIPDDLSVEDLMAQVDELEQRIYNQLHPHCKADRALGRVKCQTRPIHSQALPMHKPKLMQWKRSSGLAARPSVRPF